MEHFDESRKFIPTFDLLMKQVKAHNEDLFVEAIKTIRTEKGEIRNRGISDIIEKANQILDNLKQQIDDQLKQLTHRNRENRFKIFGLIPLTWGWVKGAVITIVLISIAAFLKEAIS